MKRGGDTSLGGDQWKFAETIWEVVTGARDPSSEVRRAALEQLCRKYWKPVYFSIRTRWAKSNEDAKDLAQAFFLWILECRRLEAYAPNRGGFRAYLKLLLGHFLQDHEKSRKRLKRGGGSQLLSLDERIGPLEQAFSDPGAQDPQGVFDRAWRAAMMTRAVERVERRLVSRGDGVKWQVFQEYSLSPLPGRPTHAELARRLKLKETDIHNYLAAVHREILSEIRAELSALARSQDELEEEWNAFFGA